LTLAFAPGECAQVDWGSFGSVAVGNTCRRLSFFVMVLCYSRMLYLEFTVSQSLEHFWPVIKMRSITWARSPNGSWSITSNPRS